MENLLLPTGWEVLSLVAKFVVYIAVASIAGASLFLVLYSDNRKQTVMPVLYYALFGALLGFQASALNYLIQVGMINDNGAVGMLDWSMGSLLLDTQLADVTLYRLLAFTVSIIVTGYFIKKTLGLSAPPNSRYFRRFFTLNTVALFALALSFRLAGHVSVLNNFAQFAVASHVLAFAFWIGILFPLYQLAKTPDLVILQSSLRRFGQHAIVLLLVLLISGGTMLWQLIHSFSEFIYSAYGLSIVFKLLIVIVIVSIAAINKLRLVPLIMTEGGALRFRRSLQLEIAAAVCILGITSYLSTIVGPMQH